MSDPDTGDFEGLPPQEALDNDERLNGDDDAVDAPEHWQGADRFGTTPAEEAVGAPLSARLAEELPDQEVPEVPLRLGSELSLDELDESVDSVEDLDAVDGDEPEDLIAESPAG